MTSCFMCCVTVIICMALLAEFVDAAFEGFVSLL